MNITLISYESIRQLEEKLNSIINKDEIFTTFDLNNYTIEDVINEAGYFSLFNDKKTIIVKNANIFGSDKINEHDTELLMSYFTNPNDMTTLIFTVNGKIDSKKKIVKAIKDKYRIINLEKYNYNDLVIKIRELSKKDGFTIDEESINYIINSCLNNYDLIYNELEKIKLFYIEPCKIKIDDVKMIVSKGIEDNNFKFVEAVISKDYKKTCKLLDDLEVIKVEALNLVSLLAREYRLMHITKTLYNENKSINSIANELKLQQWQADKLLKNSFKYTLEELEDNLVILTECDLDIKKIYFNKYTLLKAYLLKIIKN